jgi:predicted O-methyltransferase YrrM
VKLPPLVERARMIADARGFDRSCRDEDGALVHVLAARRGIGRVAEIGTGAGIGTAWLASALTPGVPLFTAGPGGARATAATAIFADDPDVHLLVGDWRAVLPPHAPFDLVLVADREAKDDPDAVLGIAAPGATLVLDDVPAAWAGRERWLSHPRVVATELRTGSDAVVLLAAVRR